MDAQTQERLDSILEDEIRRGFRIKELPADLKAQLKVEGIAAFERVRFSRLNPRRKSRISSAVQDRYHQDLKNQSILSNEQIAKLVAERGEWTTDQADRLINLMDDTQRLQSELYIEGLGDSDWQSEMISAATLLRKLIEEAEYVDKAEQKKVLEVLDRWSEYMPLRRGPYTILYAAEQGKPEYSPDWDLDYLLERMPVQEAVDALHLLDDLRDKAIRFIELQDKRRELAILQNKHAKIFADSVESRRDQAEEMARVYFCTQIVDAADKPVGMIAATLDSFWDFPEDLIQWLIIEHYFFANGLPDAARDYLETFGFLKAETEKSETTTNAGELEPSVELPAPPSSKGASTPEEEMAARSSV
jgi:hypothetical protein